MKPFVLLLGCVALCAGMAVNIREKVVLKNLENVKVDIDEKFAMDMVKTFENARGDVRNIKADLNEFADRLLINIQLFCIKNQLDPVGMPDIKQSFLIADLSLTVGKLEGISTMHRKGDVTVDYSSTKRLLEVTVPIEFTLMKFHYDYSAKLLGLGPSGGIDGQITDLNVKFSLDFDFVTDHASLKTFTLVNSGHIDFTFTGNIFDILVNILSEFTTTILHPFIVGIVEAIVKGVLNAIINVINDVIDSILHPPTITSTISTVASILLQ